MNRTLGEVAEAAEAEVEDPMKRVLREVAVAVVYDSRNCTSGEVVVAGVEDPLKVASGSVYAGCVGLLVASCRHVVGVSSVSLTHRFFSSVTS